MFKSLSAYNLRLSAGLVAGFLLAAPASATPDQGGSFSGGKEFKLAHCCHAHNYAPYTSDCCHPPTAVYVAPAYGYGAASVRGVSRRTSRRTSRRVSRRR